MQYKWLITTNMTDNSSGTKLQVDNGATTDQAGVDPVQLVYNIARRHHQVLLINSTLICPITTSGEWGIPTLKWGGGVISEGMDFIFILQRFPCLIVIHTHLEHLFK